MAPTLVENAGLPLTPYYQYLLALAGGPGRDSCQ